MPIKLPKTFNRRRSSGNANDLAEGQAEPAKSSFRVLDRPPERIEGPDKYKRPIPRIRRPNTSPGPLRRPQSYGDGSESSNRGSGNTNSTGDAFSTNRFSYSSTVPSSVDYSSQDDLPLRERLNHAAAPRNTPEPRESHAQQQPKTFSLKAAGRALSFGPKNSKSSTKENAYEPPLPTTRPRTMTESSYASTAVPPKLDLGGSDLGLGDSDFSSMFSKRRSTILEESNSAPTVPNTQDSEAFKLPQSSSAPQHWPSADPPSLPPQTLSPPQKPGSPFSFSSNASQEKLITSPRELPLAHFADTEPPSSATQPGGFMDAIYASNALESIYNPQSPKPEPIKQNKIPSNRPRPPSRPLSNVLVHPSRPSPPPQKFRRTPPTAWANSRAPSGLFGSHDDDIVSDSMPKDAVTPADEEPLFDAPRPLGLARSTARASKVPQQPLKILTNDQFEEYKHQKEAASQDEDTRSEASPESDNYDDDDEVERNKQAAKQRRKQEAHLAVYRQQMMKVTGEQPSELPNTPTRTPLARSTATVPNFLANLSFDPKPENEKKSPKSSDEDDDDVPLGVLQAHGFPHKSRPPTRIASNSTNSIPRPESQLSSYPSPAGASRNDQAAGGGGHLPAFARNLPQDPYLGASLVNTPRRESLGFTSAGQHQAPPSNLPPGGLVGVIAGEERAKAARRGSPNTNGTYDPTHASQMPLPSSMQTPMTQLGMPHNQTGGHMATMPQHPLQMSPTEQSQIAMNNQVAQMMQMQMQMMQQWMQMQGTNGNQQPPQLPQFPLQNDFLSGLNNPLRPNSMPSSGSSGSGARSSMMPNGARPSSSHLSANMGMGGAKSSAQSVYGVPASGAGYAPSMAPSERSNVGQPSRYRPVSTAINVSNDEGRTSRASTMSANTVQGLGRGGRDSRAKSQPPNNRSSSNLRHSTTPSIPAVPPTTIKAISKPKHGGGSDDDDDEQGWAEMQRKRHQRQSKWKLKSSTTSDANVGQQEGLEGLYYQGPSSPTL